MATLYKSNLNEAYIDSHEAEAKKKDSQVKASFKIEINEEEKIARDSTTTNVYHTGIHNTMITMSEDDKMEL